MRAPNSDDFRGYIIQRFRDGETEVKTFIDLKAGEVHRGVGGYPAPDGNHRMLVCCQVTKGEMQFGDEILFSPPSGQGALLQIRYRLPRNWLNA